MSELRYWHPSRDPYHCGFRMLLATYKASPAVLSLAKLSLLDLYILFPHYLRELEGLPRQVRRSLTALRLPARKDSYVILPDIRLVYRELQPLQRATYQGLVAKRFFSMADARASNARLIVENVPFPLLERVKRKLEVESEYFDFLVQKIGSMPLDGNEGLLRKAHLELGGGLR